VAISECAIRSEELFPVLRDWSTGGVGLFCNDSDDILFKMVSLLIGFDAGIGSNFGLTKRWLDLIENDIFIIENNKN